MNPSSRICGFGQIAMFAALASCSAAVGSDKGGSGGSSSPSGTGTSGSGGSGADMGGGPGGNSDDDPIHCVPGVPATTQLRRMKNWQYDTTLRDLLGVTSVGTGADAKPPSALLYADFEGPMVPDAWRLYQDTAAAIAKAVMGNPMQKAKFINCDPAASGCLATTIKTFGRKAFRRPLTDVEVTRFLALGTGMPTGTPAEVAEATLLAFLVSPSFLLLPETSADPASPGQFALNGYEVATRLSYMLWGSVPDDTLNAAADGDQLRTNEQILSQAKRMILVRDKTAPLVSAFHRQWVQMDNASAHWWNGDHDHTKYPLYSADAKATYSAELDNFFAEVAFASGTFKDLFLSNVGFVNDDNAGVYGVSSPGKTLTKVQLDPVQRPGFLTRAGFLSSYSHYDETSPILRGAFITIYMIGVDPGPPLPGATMLKPPAGNYQTNREKTDALVNQSASCKGCHVQVINPAGYVLENYDAIGKWQTVDPLTGPINATADVNFGDDNVKKITNAQELMQELAKSPKGQQSYAKAWVAYGYGRDTNENDQCVVDQISNKLSREGYPILDVLSDLAQADSFRLRVRATP